MARTVKKRLFYWGSMGAIALFICVRLYLYLTDDFRISHVTYELPYRSEWAISSLSAQEQERLDGILSQTFSYLGKGEQCYVFQSNDQQYVLKLFKYKHLRPSQLLAWLPSIYPFSTYQKRQEARIQRKLLNLFGGYKLAYDHHRLESGLIYIQLNPTHVTYPLTLIDKIGLTRTVDLGEVAFIIQEKGQNLKNILTHDLNENHLDLAKQHIRQIIELYLTEYRKGIYDHDHGVLQNTGFVGERPIHLDVGKLVSDQQISQPAVYEQDLEKVKTRIREWLIDAYPEYSDEFSVLSSVE